MGRSAGVLDHDRRADGEISRLGRRYERSRLLERDDGFKVWYEVDGRAVGVLTCNADDDYELGARLIESGEPVPVPMPR